MSVNCVSASCRKKIDSLWHFCPYCGEDNRSPADQIKVGSHSHRYLHRKGCCLLCGEPSDEPYLFGRRWRVGISLSLLIVSAVLLLTSLNIALAGIDKPSIAKSYIRAWYEEPMKRSRKGHTWYTTRGQDRIETFAICGSLIGVLGTLLLVKSPLTWINKGVAWD